MLKDIVFKNRSYRRFFEDQAISRDTLVELVELARICPSAANRQPLKFIFSCDKKTNEIIFPHTRWAGYLKEGGAPKVGERPSAYIIILGDTFITKDYHWGDHGIVAQTIMLGAVEKGLGGCMIGSIDKEGLRKALNIDPKFEIMLILALGKPKEKVVLDDIKDGDIKYWRDEEGTHHVPKRKLEELILPSPEQ